MPSETLVVGPNTGVKGSVILIEGVGGGRKAEGGLILDNAHGFLGPRPIFNSALSVKGRVVDVTTRLGQPGVVKVLCDVHTHMTVWIVVHDSPYFAVTDDQGHFKIDGIPPWEYWVTMWHEGFTPKGVDKDGRPVYEEWRLQREVTIPRGGSAAVDFEIK